MSKTCQNCRFFEARTAGEGECRFSAPAAEGWPKVTKKDWCGKHEAA